jgi:hypothetical protein
MPSSEPSSAPSFDFIALGNSPFYYEMTPKTWAGCLSYGQFHGYELASIVDSDEANELKAELNSLNLPDAWCGGHMPPLTDSWIWTDQTAFETSISTASATPGTTDNCLTFHNDGVLTNDGCNDLKLCVYKIGSTNAPSVSAKPSSSPSSSTSPTRSSKPTISHFPSAPSASPTELSPSASSAPTNAWNIGGAFVNFETNVNPQMEVTHAIGSAAENIKVTLLDYECQNELVTTDSTHLVDSATILSGTVAPGPTVKYTVEFENFDDSLVIDDNRVTFCTKLELLDGDDFSVQFRMQKFAL